MIIITCFQAPFFSFLFFSSLSFFLSFSFVQKEWALEISQKSEAREEKEKEDKQKKTNQARPPPPKGDYILRFWILMENSTYDVCNVRQRTYIHILGSRHLNFPSSNPPATYRSSKKCHPSAPSPRWTCSGSMQQTSIRSQKTTTSPSTSTISPDGPPTFARWRVPGGE